MNLKDVVDLSAPLTIPEVARLMGWFMPGSKRPNTLLARRRLLHLHKESGGTLLVANGRHYLVRSAERLASRTT